MTAVRTMPANSLIGTVKRALANTRQASLRTAEKVLFDEAHYLSQLTEDLPKNVKPISHYDAVGAAMGLSPHPVIDPDFLAAQLRGNRYENFIATLHANRSAPFISPSRLFDPDTYLDALPVEARNVAEATGHPILHFLRHWTDYRVPFSRYFDVAFYIRTHDGYDSQAENPLLHYLRQPSGVRGDANPMFHAGYYRHTYHCTATDMLTHFLAEGHVDRRLPNPYARAEIGEEQAVSPEALLAYIRVDD